MKVPSPKNTVFEFFEIQTRQNMFIQFLGQWFQFSRLWILTQKYALKTNLRNKNKKYALKTNLRNKNKKYAIKTNLRQDFRWRRSRERRVRRPWRRRPCSPTWTRSTPRTGPWRRSWSCAWSQRSSTEAILWTETDRCCLVISKIN